MIVAGAAGRTSYSATSWDYGGLADTHGLGESITQVDILNARIHWHDISRISLGLSSKIAVLIGRRALSSVERAEPGAVYWAVSRHTGCQGAASDVG